MTITSLMDDYCPRRGFRGEHGLSLYIEHGSTRLLFDSGQSALFMENARELGISLDDLDAIVLSHGHYDHGGGLGALYAAARAAPRVLYAGRGFDDSRWAAEGGGLRDIGLARQAALELRPRAALVEKTLRIAEGLFLMPCAEMTSDASIDPRFRALALGGAAAMGQSEGADRPDLFEDELSLIAVDESGLTVVTGCAHRGILNIVRAALCAFPGKPIRAVVGGFHLGALPDTALAEVVAELAALGPTALYPCHCTGIRGFAAIDAALHGKAAWLSCGMRIEL